MKIRQDFVTNSSSSSFVVAKALLSNAQIIALKMLDRHENEHCPDTWWSITEDENYIEGYTTMDNGGLDVFLLMIDIDPKIVKRMD